MIPPDVTELARRVGQPGLPYQTFNPVTRRREDPQSLRLVDLWRRYSEPQSRGFEPSRR